MTTHERDVLAGVMLLHKLVETPPRSIDEYVREYQEIRKELSDYDFNVQVHEKLEEIANECK